MKRFFKLAVLATAFVMLLSCAGIKSGPAPAPINDRQIITVTNDLDYKVTGRLHRLGCKLPRNDGSFLYLIECTAFVAELDPGESYTKDVTGAEEFSIVTEGDPAVYFIASFKLNTFSGEDKPKFRQSVLIRVPIGVPGSYEAFASQCLKRPDNHI